MYRACEIRLAGISPSGPIRPSFGREIPTVGDGLLLSFPDFPIGTVWSSSPLVRLCQAPPGLGRYRWRLLGDGIIEGRSTEIEHELLWPVTLHQLRMEFTRQSAETHWLFAVGTLGDSLRYIHEREALYSKRTRRFIGSLDLCRTQRRMTP